MTKVLKKEQHLAQQHPVSWPLIVILGGTVLIIFVLLGLLFRGMDENSKLHQRLDENQPVQNMQQNQMNDYINTEDGL